MLCRRGCLAFAFLLPAVAHGQQIRGVVVEDSTSLPLSDAKIELLTADSSVLASKISAGTGWFEFSLPTPGRFVIRASHYAYRTTHEVAVVAGPQEGITLVLRLSGGPIPVDPVIANARAYDRLAGYRERARNAAFGRFITRADIDKLGGYSLSHVLRFTPEVRIESVRDGAFVGKGVFMRSYGDMCVPSIILDGVAMPTGSGFDIDALLTQQEIEGIEVYRSYLSAPMEMRMPVIGGDMSCGVIAIWSRVMPGGQMTLKRAFFAGSLVGASLLLLRVLQ